MDGLLHRLAGGQHQVVAHRQLVALGYTDNMIHYRLRAGVLFRISRGIYGVTGAPPTFEFRLMAAVLGAGDGALVSHRSAAALFHLRRLETAEVHVSVAGRMPPRIGSVVAHRSRAFAPGERATINRIPVTAPARILADLAGETDPAVLEGALDDVLVRKLATLAAVERQVRRSRRPGAPLLRALVRERRAGKKPTESALEDDLAALIRRYGLPEPERQYEIDGGDIRFDYAYPARWLDFEADGAAFHAGAADQRSDRARDERVRAQGWTVTRFSTDDIRDRPDEVAATIARLLARTGPAIFSGP